MLNNPQKDFRYALELNGVNMFLMQEVQPPKAGVAVVEHGSPGNMPNGKTPGKPKVSEMVVKKLKPADRPDTWAWDLLAAAISGLKGAYAGIGFLVEYGPDCVTVVDKKFLGDIWVSDIEESNKNSMGSNNVIETVTFQVQYYYPMSSPAFAALFGGSALGAGGAAASMGIR